MSFRAVLLVGILAFTPKIFALTCESLFTTSKTPDADRIYSQFGIADKYPEKVVRQAQKLLARGIKDIDLEGREDLTGLNFITIDGKETIDRDDAIFVKALLGGNFILKVAVPDIGAFISPQSAIGRWYFDQSTSHYLREKVFHLLPPEVVTGLLSIDPGQKRLAMVYEVEYDAKSGKLKNFKAQRALIRSKRAYTYREFQKSIDDPNSRSASEARIIDLYEQLSLTRNQSLSFPFSTEKRPLTDEAGEVIGFAPRETITANHLIEVFMVAINSEGAKFMTRNGIPGIFRGQEEPNERKLETFYQILEKLSIRVKYDPTISELENLQVAFDALRKYKYPSVVLPLLYYVTHLAENSVYSQPHYFLNVDAYSFLTSPLRRVSDYWNQYMISRFLTGELKSKDVFDLLAEQEKIVETDNDNMILAKQAENLWVSVKELKLLPADIKGKTFKGVYVREFTDTIMFYIPELETYAFEEKFEAEIPRQPFKHFGKKYDIRVKEVDLESGRVLLGIM